MRNFSFLLLLSLTAVNAWPADENITRRFSEEFRVMATGTAAEKGWSEVPVECSDMSDAGCSASRSVKAKHLVRLGKALSSRGFIRKISHPVSPARAGAAKWQSKLFFEFQLYSGMHTETYDGRVLTGKTWQSPLLSGTLKVWLSSDLHNGWDICSKVVNGPGVNLSLPKEWIEQVMSSRLTQHLRDILDTADLPVRISKTGF